MTSISLAATNVITWMSAKPKPLIVFLSGVMLLALGIVDALSGPDLSVLTFYFLPVLVCTWFVGRSAGVVMSMLGSVEWIAADVLTSPEHMPPGITVWNASIHFAFFIFAVWTVGELKESLQREERAVRERIEGEIETAREVQFALLPKVPETKIRRFDVSASCEPARGIGGDIYDFISFGDDRLVFALGDVSGKGVAAALLGASLLAGLRSLAPLHRQRLDLLMDDLNRLLFTESPTVRFATLFIGEFEFSSSRLRWVNAAHTPPILFSAGAESPRRLTSSGTILGAFAERTWKQCETTLARGDVLILFSDGLSETRDAAEQEFGEQRIVQLAQPMIAQPAARIRTALIEEATRFSGNAALTDDRTVVVLRRT